MLENNLWRPLCLRRLPTRVGRCNRNPLLVHLRFLSVGMTALLSGEPRRAPFQVAFCWGSGALHSTKLFPWHAKLKLFGEILRSECSPVSLGLPWNGRNLVPCPWSGGHLVSAQSTGTRSLLTPGRAWLLPDVAAAVDTFSLPFFLPGSQQPGVPYYTDPGGPVMNPMAMAFHVQPNSPQGNPVYPPPPSYCNTPPPPYEQVVKSSTWGLCGALTWLWEEGAIAKWPRWWASALFEHLLVLRVLSPSLPCTFPH